MDELIRESGGQTERYEELIMERDRLEKEAIHIGRLYTCEFGQLLTDIYEEKIECIKLRKMIAFCQAAANRGEEPDQDVMIEQLQREMAEYYANLQDMIRRNEAARKGRILSEYEEKRIRDLYRWIAKQLHPDTHPMTEEIPGLMDLWNQALLAYQANDLKRLTEAAALVRKALADLGGEVPAVEMPDIALRIEELEKEIDEIRTTEPYTWRMLLEDEEACEKTKAELRDGLRQYREYRQQLEDVLDGLMNA